MRARLWWGAGALVVVLVAAGAAAWLLQGRDAGAAPPLDGEMRTFDVVQPPEPAPEVTFSDAAGNTLTLDDFAGQVVLVNFWATWCAPCVDEMPSLDRLQARSGGDGLTVLTLSLDRGGAAPVQRFFTRHGLEHLDAYLDPQGTAMRAFSITVLPTTILINGNGRVVGRYTGPAEWDSAEAVALVDYYLNRDTGG